MYKYLLPGSEFHDKLRQSNPDMDSSVVTVVFEYTDNVEHLVEGLDSLSVASDNSDAIKASFSEDGTNLYVYSDYDIRTTDCQMMFYRMSLLSRVKFNNFNTDECTNMRRMFMNCTSLPFVDMSNLSSVNVEDFTEMFSGCSSCFSINIKEFQVPSTKETCVFSDMFKELTSLRRLSVGNKFTFSGSMSLSNPDIDTIPGSDGLWYFPKTSSSFTSDQLTGGVEGTYYAYDVLSNNHDQELLTVGSLKESMKAVVMEFANTLKILGNV